MVKTKVNKEKSTVRKPLESPAENVGTERGLPRADEERDEHRKFLAELMTPEQRQIIVSQICVNCIYHEGRQKKCNCLNTCGFRREE